MTPQQIVELWMHAPISHNGLELVHGLGVLALVSMSYGFLLRNAAPRVAKGAAVGVVFGVGGVLAMADPVQVSPGVVIDARGVILMLAAPFGGPIAALISAMLTIAFRFWIGGAGMAPGIIGIVIAAAAGVVFSQFVHRPNSSYATRQLLSLGALGSSMGLALLLLLPASIMWPVLQITFLPLTLVNVLGVLLLGGFLSSEADRLHAARRSEREASTDALTELPNRRNFDRASESLFQEARKAGSPLALLMIDIDHFKQVNDRWGHDVGDMMLKAIARTIQANVRSCDLVARYGGEEIVVMMPAASVAEATAVAERIREAVDRDVFYQSREIFNITVSIGVAIDEGSAADFNRLMRTADEALYRAKDAGRNRVEVTQNPLSQAA